MQNKGVTYDVGTEYTSGNFTRDNFDAFIAEADMNAIKNELHCNSVRVFGKKPDSLLLAANAALENGLNVWLSPRLIDGTIEETIVYIEEVAGRLQELSARFPKQEVVFIVAGEATIDMQGFVKGTTIHQRISNLTKPMFFLKNALGIKPPFQTQFSEFLGDAVSLVRKRFSGKVTYASAMWEIVDWSIFDILSVNLYKASFNKTFFDRKLKKVMSSEKPVAITEFGCCTFEGADKMGPTGYVVLDASMDPPVFKTACVRNEQVQANYVIDLLDKYNSAGVASTFVFDFYSAKLFHDANSYLDLDKASFSITKHSRQNKWEPKLSFKKIADFYAHH